MRSVIRYAGAFSDEYNTPFKDARVKDIAQDMERTNLLYMKITSTCERFTCIVKWFYKFKTVMTRINTIEQFVASKEYGNSDVTYLDSRILIHGTGEDKLLLFGADSYFEKPSEGMFDANLFY